jgi:hypothetical protein
MTDAELDGKVRDLCAPVLGDRGTDRLIAACRGVAAAPSLERVIEACLPSR